MGIVSLTNNNSNNGTATPATPGSITVVSPDMAVLCIAVAGTSPTIGTPASWTAVQVVNGASLSFAMFILPNASGATNPSSVLGGTVTGWYASIYELTATGANEGLISSATSSQSVAQLTNIFPTNLGQAQPNELFLYAVARLGNTALTAQNTGLNTATIPGYPSGPSSWSSSVLGVTNVQGLSFDFYWGQSANAWPCPYPSASGLLGSAVASIQIGAWFNSQATIPSRVEVANIGGYSGSYIGPYNAGVIGG